MPKGPNGQKRPADSIGCAVSVARIATGEDDDTGYVSQNRRKSGVAGAKARMETTSAEQRSEIATRAAKARWKSQEATMNLDHNACGDVAAIYAQKKSEGLRDVKFLFQNRSEASLTEACEELAAFNQGMVDGVAKVLDFGDLDWK